MKNKNFFRKLGNCISYDIREGIFRFLPLYGLTLIFVAAFGQDARMRLSEGTTTPSVIDLLVYIFQGMEEYVFVKGGPAFDIPITFLTLSFCFALFASYYARREWKMRGTTYLLRYQSKILFWISKCVWCILQMMIMYALMFLVLWAMAAYHGNATFELSSEALPYLKGMAMTEDSLEYMKYIFGLGMFTAITLNQLQLTLQMITTPVVGYTAVIAVLTSSAYFYRVYMPGNYYMLLRTALFQENGITLKQGFFVLAIIWLVLVCLGGIVVKRKDVL